MRKGILLPIILVGSALSGAEARTERELNCRVEVVDKKPIYGGAASCVAHYSVNTCSPTHNGFDVIVTNKTLPISQYIEAHSRSSIRLSAVVEYYENYGVGPNACSLPKKTTEFVGCDANLELLRYEDIKERVCDYTPNVTVRGRQFSELEVAFKADTSDRDGSIVKREWTVNDVPASSSPFLTYEQGDEILLIGQNGQSLYTCLTVTDNDGYTSKSCDGITIQRHGSINPYE
ncbi:hypothetical protein [Pseudoalteromonas sp. DY56-GL79]|uniref:hypothetical protein n=1 Tax=Pseudoalteromonas sp. DY56-GL79 TaxID=2967131 RepID=UPI00352A86EA